MKWAKKNAFSDSPLWMKQCKLPGMKWSNQTIEGHFRNKRHQSMGWPGICPRIDTYFLYFIKWLDGEIRRFIEINKVQYSKEYKLNIDFSEYDFTSKKFADKESIEIHEMFLKWNELLTTKWTAKEFVQDYIEFKNEDNAVATYYPTLGVGHISQLRCKKNLPDRHGKIYNWRVCVKHWINTRIFETQ